LRVKVDDFNRAYIFERTVGIKIIYHDEFGKTDITLERVEPLFENFRRMAGGAFPGREDGWR